ncbi:MAG: secretin N-terminal domain-containing protein [Candidatus Omnitrophota bacterium]
MILFAATPALSQSDELEMQIFQINNGNSRSICDVVRDLKSDEGKVTLDANTDTIVVLDYPKNVARIAEVIDKLDVRQRQINIEVEIADVTSDLVKELGIKSGYAVLPRGRLTALIGANDENKDINTRKSLKVRTVSNRPASLQVTVDEVFGSMIYHHHDRHHADTYVLPIYAQTGDTLWALPRVNNDGTIQISVYPSSGVIDEAGELKQKSAITEVIVKNGETIVMAGYSSSADERKKAKVPIIDIGRYKKRSSSSENLLMFLTATIVE